MTNKQTVGTCSLCGGPVQLPTSWMSVVPPRPTCASCGAVERKHGPVIEMERPQPPRKVLLGLTEEDVPCTD